MQILEYLQNNGIEFKENHSQYMIRECPYCEPNKDFFGHFYFAQDTGVFFCQKCNEKGNLFKFRLDRGEIMDSALKKPFYRPDDRPELISDTDKFYAWYKKNRGIEIDILRKYKVGVETRDSKKFMVYQYIDQNDRIINRKFKSCTDKKKLWCEKGAEQIYYGLNNIDFNLGALFVVEGEDDCHALAQIGLTNVVSVPNGASGYSPALDKINNRFQELILMFDNDEAGRKGSKKFAEKAGVHKCIDVFLPFKDARECIQNGLKCDDFYKLVNKGTRYKHSEVAKAGDFKEDFLKADECGYQLDHKQFNNILGGIRMGEMTVITGHTGCGKTTFVNNLACWCVDKGLPTMVMSFENKVKKVLQKLIQIRTGKSIYKYNEFTGKTSVVMDDTFLMAELDKLDTEEFYFLNVDNDRKGYYDTDKMEKIIEYGVKFHNIKLFLIDHLHYFLKIKNKDGAVHEIDEAVRTIKQWSNRFNCHIGLVAHPSKQEDSSKGKLSTLGLSCVKGASAIPQESDNFIVVDRPQDTDIKESKIRILKNREMGNLGSIKYDVKENNNTFTEKQEDSL